MEEKRLRDFIERFFNAELTCEEENMLYRYLHENDVPAELRKDKEVIIALLGKPEEPEMPAGATERLTTLLDKLEKTERKQIADKKETTTEKIIVRKIPRMLIGVSAATAIIVYMTLPAIVQEDTTTATQAIVDNSEKDTFDNPQDAMRCFKAVCNNMTLAINAAHDNTREIGNTLEETVAPYRNIIKINRQ